MSASPSKGEAVRVALESARLKGCVCKPDVRVVKYSGRLFLAQVFHDDWCPLAQGAP